MLPRLVKNFVEEVICLEHALKEVITRLDPEFSKDHEFRAGFEGSFGDRHVNPRSLKSSFLGNLVCCEGIVTRCKPSPLISITIKIAFGRNCQDD